MSEQTVRDALLRVVGSLSGNHQEALSRFLPVVDDFRRTRRSSKHPHGRLVRFRRHLTPTEASDQELLSAVCDYVTDLSARGDFDDLLDTSEVYVEPEE